jgi:hypothetical protein
MSIVLSTFVPVGQVSPGKNGLHWKKGSTSSATLTGSGLVNGLSVTVLFPKKATNPVIQWTGTTFNSNSTNTSCDVTLTEQLENNGPPPHPIDDDSVTVSVTATDGTTTSNTIDPTVSTAS